MNMLTIMMQVKISGQMKKIEKKQLINCQKEINLWNSNNLNKELNLILSQGNSLPNNLRWMIKHLKKKESSLCNKNKKNSIRRRWKKQKRIMIQE